MTGLEPVLLFSILSILLELFSVLCWGRRDKSIIKIKLIHKGIFLKRQNKYEPGSQYWFSFQMLSKVMFSIWVQPKISHAFAISSHPGFIRVPGVLCRFWEKAGS